MCRLWENSAESLWGFVFFTNSLHQLLSLPRVFVLHIMRHFSKLLEVLETLWHGRKMKATRPEMPALCRGDWKSLVPALTNSVFARGGQIVLGSCINYNRTSSYLAEEHVKMSPLLACFPTMHSPTDSVSHLLQSHPWYRNPFNELLLQYWFEFRFCASHSLVGIKS